MMKNLFVIVRKKCASLAVAVSALVVAGAAHAQSSLPDWASDIGADAAATGTDAASLVGPVIGGVILSLLAIKLIKRFVNRV